MNKGEHFVLPALMFRTWDIGGGTPALMLHIRGIGSGTPALMFRTRYIGGGTPTLNLSARLYIIKKALDRQDLKSTTDSISLQESGKPKIS